MDSRILRDEERKFFKTINLRAQADISQFQSTDYLKNFQAQSKILNPNLKKVKNYLSDSLATESDSIQLDKIDQ